MYAFFQCFFGFFHFIFIFLLSDVASIELSPMLKHCIVLNVMKDKRIEHREKQKVTHKRRQAAWTLPLLLAVFSINVEVAGVGRVSSSIL